MNKKQKKKLYKIISAAALTLIFKFLPFNGYIMFVLYLVPYLLVGFDSLKKAWKGIKKGQVFDENFLMAIATIGAFSVALISGSGDYVEAVAVMLFYQIGELFENYAVGKSRKNISALMDIRPDYANLCIDGEIKKVDPDEVTVGSIISVGPGEKIPLDGVVVEGVANLDTSALTGESKPRSISVDEEVTSGCICLDAVIKIKTTRPFGESTVSKILELVENASSRKSKSENFISKFAKIYTPTVCYAALALAILPPVMNLIRGIDANVMTWVYRALTFLVISCPCALVISIPLGFFAGIGGASRAGVLVKGSNYIESLSKIDTIVFDKTGTLTKGVFDVTEIHENEGAYSKDDLLELAAYTEGFSTHPIGKSVLAAYGKEIDKNKVSDVKEYAGEGVTARVDGKIIYAGNGKLMRRFDIAYKKCHIDGTIVYVAEDGEYAGHIVISDVPKETSKEAIDKLHKLGISNTVMLTGDATTIAKEVADELGIKEYYAKLMPQDKVSKVEELIGKQKEGKALAFVGDGINDAPVLTRADIGIAMGSMGSDAAIEAADVVLMDDNPLGIVKAIKIARKCMTIVYENIYLAIGVKLICLLLGAMGFAGMWLAIFADVGVMILAVLNAIRTLKVPRI